MFKKIMMNGEELPILTTAATNVYYRQIFGEDALALQSEGTMTIAQQVEFAQKLMFVAAKQAEGQALTVAGKASSVRDYMRTIDEDAYIDWLDTVDFGDVNGAAADVMQAYIGGSKSTSRAKKE